MWVTTTTVDPLLPVETPQQVVQSVPGLLVEVPVGSSASSARGRLDQGPRHRHPLLLAAGERARPVVGAVRQAQLVQQRLAPRRGPPPPAARAMSSGIITFSSAVNSGSRWWNWKTKPERPVAERAQPRPRAGANTSSPPTVTVPRLGPVERAEDVQQRRLPHAGGAR